MFFFKNAFTQSMSAFSMNMFANSFMNLSSGTNLFNFSPMSSIFASFSPFNSFNFNSNNSIFSPSTSTVNFAQLYQPVSPPIFQLSNLNLSIPPTSMVNTNLGMNQLSPSPGGDVNQRMLQTANSYVGKVNTSAEGNRLFSPAGYKNTGWYRSKGSWGWCCDFAVHCMKQAMNGNYPKDMVTSSPGGLAKAAGTHNAYMQAPSGDKANWIANNIKPGDVIYMKGRGASGKHIAIFESISNGVIHAISGNYAHAVKKHTIKNLSEVYGFVSLGKICSA